MLTVADGRRRRSLAWGSGAVRGGAAPCVEEAEDAAAEWGTGAVRGGGGRACVEERRPAPCVEEAVAAAEWGSGALHVEEAEDAAAEWGSLAASPLLCSVAGGNEMRKKKGPAARGFIAGTPLVPVHGMNGD